VTMTTTMTRGGEGICDETPELSHARTNELNVCYLIRLIIHVWDGIFGVFVEHPDVRSHLHYLSVCLSSRGAAADGDTKQKWCAWRCQGNVPSSFDTKRKRILEVDRQLQSRGIDHQRPHGSI
jgi:hypothetical protein